MDAMLSIVVLLCALQRVTAQIDQCEPDAAGMPPCPTGTVCRMMDTNCSPEPCPPFKVCMNPEYLAPRQGECAQGEPVIHINGSQMVCDYRDSNSCPLTTFCSTEVMDVASVCCLVRSPTTRPPVDKPGACPVATGPGTCAEECTGDSDCPGSEKCCSNGCGHVCRLPAGITTTMAPVTENPCDRYQCPFNQVCRLVESICASGRCAPVPVCYDPASLPPGESGCRRGRPVLRQNLYTWVCDYRDPNACPPSTFCSTDLLDVSSVCCWETPKTTPATPTAKPGVCPPSQFGACVELCSDDYSCSGQEKCCSNGCGHVCMMPADFSTTTLSPVKRNPCEQYSCPANQVCRLVEIQCFAPPCNPVPRCYNPTLLPPGESGCMEGEPILRQSLYTWTCNSRDPYSCPPSTFCSTALQDVASVCCWQTKSASPSPPTTKPGQCPPPGVGTCVELCGGDYSCPGQEKCCSNGCGHVCMMPVMETTTTMAPVIENPCERHLCPTNQVCRLVEVQCVRAPCYPHPQCFDPASLPPGESGCMEGEPILRQSLYTWTCDSTNPYSCPASTFCSTALQDVASVCCWQRKTVSPSTAPPTVHPVCIATTCLQGYECVPQMPSPCPPFGPCQLQGVCVPTGVTTTPPPPGDPCETWSCPGAQECRLRERSSCTSCPPEPVCIERRGATGLTCPTGRPVLDVNNAEMFCGFSPQRRNCIAGTFCDVWPNDGNGACCYKKPPSTPKPGQCPPNLPQNCQSNPCQDDYDCGGDQKCCPNGCTNTCVSPIPEIPEETCGTKTCAPGLECRLMEVYCTKQPCFPRPMCVPVTPVGENPCSYGRPVLDILGNEMFCGRGPNRRDCLNGTFCKIAPDDTYAVCCKGPDMVTTSTPTPSPCETKYCEPGYTCIELPTPCAPPGPCQSVAVCQPITPTTPASLVDRCAGMNCPFGQECRLVEVSCFTSPCPPQPSCVARTPQTQNRCPVGRPVLDSSYTEIFCGRGNNRRDCIDGTYCKIAPNDAYAVCCQSEQPTPTTPVLNPCQTKTCDAGYRCVELATPCAPPGPCPFVAVCERIPGFWKDGACPAYSDISSCQNKCETDIDCIQNWKCCDSPCGKTCAVPLQTTTAVVTTRSPETLCHTVRCSQGYECRVKYPCQFLPCNSPPRAACVRTLSSNQFCTVGRPVVLSQENEIYCAFQRCPSGSHCFLGVVRVCCPGDEMVTTTPPPPPMPCESVTCYEGTYCENRRYSCFTPPCYRAECVPYSTTTSPQPGCQGYTCPPGQECRIEVFPCIFPPCPTGPRCRASSVSTTTMSLVKPGTCPSMTGGGGVCAELCSSDYSCSGNLKCCSNGCGHSCMAPQKPGEKEGRCPSTEGRVGTCVERCSLDTDCFGKQKCCSNGCGHTCQNPEPDTTIVKEGDCPPLADVFGTCVNTCSYDASCPGRQKCCSNGCGMTCQNPYKPPKPGKCPVPVGNGICIHGCSGDSECSNDLKCCSNGCGRTCQRPVSTPPPVHFGTDPCARRRCGANRVCRLQQPFCWFWESCTARATCLRDDYIQTQPRVCRSGYPLINLREREISCDGFFQRCPTNSVCIKGVCCWETGSSPPPPPVLTTAKPNRCPRESNISWLFCLFAVLHCENDQSCPAGTSCCYLSGCRRRGCIAPDV